MHAEDNAPIAVAEFDAASLADAAAELMPCCSSRRWVAALVAGRPYVRLDRLSVASDALLARLDWPELQEALAGHPRIGERTPAGSREGNWSRQEQSGAATASERLQRELAEANQAYEQRFGHVFLICASGLSAQAMLATLRSRLRNDPVAEREVLRAELTKIVRLRLGKAFR